MPSFKAFVGGKLGSGSQWMSWIHLDDLVGIIHHALTTAMQGPVNGTAPKPATNLEFTQALASAMGRPAIFPVPAFVVKALFGEMSSVLLGSQRVLPSAAEAADYHYQYPELRAALKNIVG